MPQGCEGCFNADMEYRKISLKAKEYAKEIGKTVAICQEGREYKFYEASFARIENYNILEFISQYN